MKILIAIILLFFLSYTSHLNFRLLSHLSSAPSILTLIILIYCISIFISSWRWYQLNKCQGISLSLSKTILPTYIGIALNNLLPGSVSGDFYRLYFLFKKIPENRSRVMTSILVDRITGLIGVFLTVCVVTLFHLNIIQGRSTLFYFVLFSFGVSLGFLILFLFSSLLSERIDIRSWLSKSFPNKKWLMPILSLLEAIYIYSKSKTTILKCLAASILIQIMIVIICQLIAKCMDFPSISFFSYIIASAVTQVANLIPITPGGIGVGEIAFAHTLTLLNPEISVTYATIFLAYRLIGIILYLPSAIVLAFSSSLKLSVVK